MPVFLRPFSAENLSNTLFCRFDFYSFFVVFCAMGFRQNARKQNKQIKGLSDFPLMLLHHRCVF